MTSRLRPVVSLALLLFVFFLPLHIHAAMEGAKLARECSCVLGQRTQMALAPASAVWAPTLVSFTQPLVTYRVVSQVQNSPRSIRAPPAL
jgi:hypothetical protein